MHDSVTGIQQEIKALTTLSAEVNSWTRTVERVFKTIEHSEAKVIQLQEANADLGAAIAELESSRNWHFRGLVALFAIVGTGAGGAVVFVWSKVTAVL